MDNNEMPATHEEVRGGTSSKIWALVGCPQRPDRDQGQRGQRSRLAISHHLELRIVRNGAYSVVQIEGDINQNTSPDVSATILGLLEKSHDKGVIVDLKGTEHIDSMGASILMEAFELAQKRNINFILTGLN
jgi:anti-anti-sigma factor